MIFILLRNLLAVDHDLVNTFSFFDIFQTSRKLFFYHMHQGKIWIEENPIKALKFTKTKHAELLDDQATNF